MRSILYIVLTIFLFSLQIKVSGQNQCKITYISNEGFLVETENNKIAFDTFFDKIDADWCDSPNDSILNLMQKNMSPFNNIDIIFISHKHRDHFDESVLINHLTINKKGIVVCPNKVKSILSKHPNYKSFRERVVSITPQEYEDSCININDIPIRIMRFEHSHTMITDTITGEPFNKHQDIENLGYLLEIDGVKLFHCGDTNPLNKKEYTTYALNEENIDIAFLERLFYARSKAGTDIINNYIKPDKIIVMHIKPGNQAMFANYFNRFENIYMFENKFDELILNINK